MYWEAETEFLAFGNGAADFIDNQRFSRPKGLKQYYQFVDSGLDPTEFPDLSEEETKEKAL
jgi:coproporphyrinogen III oxidase-like Fe-S oxidoreductase